MLSSKAAMRRVFAMFDKDGNGEIDRAELQQVFLELGKFFTEDEVRVSKNFLCCHFISFVGHSVNLSPYSMSF